MLTGLLLVGRRPSRPLVISALGMVAVPLPCLLLAVHAPAAAVGAPRVLAFAAAWGLVSGVAVCCLPPIRAVRWQVRAG